MICSDCSRGDHGGCVDVVRLAEFEEWLGASPVPVADCMARVIRPYRSCDCQHKVPALDAVPTSIITGSDRTPSHSG